jgi:predicted metalloprotease with PDZ domain
LCFAFSISAQNLEIKIKMSAPENAKISVSGKFKNDRTERNFSFINTYADSVNLAERIENLKFFDKNNQEIAFQKIGDGEFLTAQNVAQFSYQILLKNPASAHVSWLSENHGLLMPNDLFPKLTQKNAANISFDLPTNWKISTNEKEIGEKRFAVENPEKAVFFIGENGRELNTDLNFTFTGDWNFSDNEASESANEILGEYKRIFSEVPFKNIKIFLLRFPQSENFDRWQAETRGANVVILSSPTTFKSLEIQRLREQLRHELFHLWMPNALNLSGNYAWFYEGFAQYAALKTGVELNHITFADFLDTISQANNINSRRSELISMIEASKMRWNGEGSSVYAKGLLIAFLCDVALTKNKKDFWKLLIEIYQKHNFSNETQDANKAILNILEERRELAPVIENYIKSANKINLQTDLNGTGIEISGSKLAVKTKLKKGEKDLLNKLGYNNWRKLLRKGK